ncbi:patatin-like phospholipase family protein, partial [Actinosynnema sp.]|uniref:patatin-like phospholipase family protein n=1 Tax=Actinosynnema sp. TaxID=1872144 RepID=UPI003F874DBD
MNYGLLEVYRHAAWNPDFQHHTEIPVYQLRTVTGASAGNINTLLWAVEACTDLRMPGVTYSSPNPDQSLFWQVWLDIGWDRLFNENSPELALFDRKALTDSARPKLETRMRDPRLVEGCQVPAGITLTRLAPDTLPLAGLSIETQRHVTAFTVQVDPEPAADGSRVRFLQETRIRPEDQYFGPVVRLQPHDRDIGLPDLLQAVKASASFPVAFAPVMLNVWYVRDGKHGLHPFVDGGAFDNNPLGLARDLYGLDSDSDTLDILYVNPRRYRSDLEVWRRTQVTPAPKGGLAAVMALLSGAVPTARQYELQLVARERLHQAEVQQYQEAVGLLQQEVRRVTANNPSSVRAEVMQVQAQLPRPGARERLLLSSRAYPVLGEHLSSFAAFLARPGREFDFYVGMYDGFYMTLSEHTCADRDSDSLRHACVGDNLDDLIRSDKVVRGAARQVLAWLYEREFGRPAGVDAPAANLREDLVVQRALFDALGTQFAPTDPGDCIDDRLVFQMLCNDGMWDVLEALHNTPEVASIIHRWSSDCGNAEQPTCRSERVFWKLIDNPMTGATTTVDELLDRLRGVEVLMRRQPPGSGKAYVAPVTGGLWLFYSSHLRSRPLYDPIPNSIPATSRLRLFPISYVGANLGTSGLEARWQPTWNVGNPGFLRGNAIVHYNGQPIRSDD